MAAAVTERRTVGFGLVFGVGVGAGVRDADFSTGVLATDVDA